MKLEFKPVDFQPGFDETTREWCAKQANARLAEMLAECPVVYGNSINEKCDNRIASHAGYGDIQLEGNTHRARLVEIEELPKE